VGIKDDMRLSVLLARARTSLRNAVPVEKMIATSAAVPIPKGRTTTTKQDPKDSNSVPYDFSYYYHKV
jgi:hypothetical protein